MPQKQTKLYVGNLPWSTTTDELAAHFSQVGGVVSVVIVSDKFTGRSRGFGFVEMESPQAAQEAIDKLNGKELGGRSLVVAFARPRPAFRSRRFSSR